MGKILEITYYEGNDRELKHNKYWINKNNVNLFIDGEIEIIFDKSIYEEDNFQECMEYIKKNYPNAKLINTSCYANGWDFKQYEI